MTAKRKSVFALAAIALGCLAALAGCSRHHGAHVTTATVVAPGPPAEIVVSEAPPRLPQETIGPAPGPGYCWVPGYWSWQGSWIWVRGAWAIPPHPHAAYVAGRWTHRGKGYVWVAGHWR
jgi:YXWGXW repeat-containing protein